MNYKSKVQYLSRYRDAMRRKRYLSEEVMRLRAEAAGTAKLFSVAPAGSPSQDRVARAVDKIMDAEAALLRQIGDAEAVRSEVLAVIDREPPRDREILHRRYLLGQRWERIAEEMHYDVRWVLRCHRRAVERIDIPEDGNHG